MTLYPAPPSTEPVLEVVTIASGDTLMALMIDAGVERRDAHAAIEAAGDLFDPRRLLPGQEVMLTFAPPPLEGGADKGPFLAVSLPDDYTRDVEVARTADTAEFAARHVPRPVQHESVHAAAAIESSLFEAGAGEGVPAQAMIQAIRALSYDVDFQRDIQPGDAFELLYERATDEQGRVVSVRNVTFAALTLSGKRLAIWRYTDSDGHEEWYHEDGHSVQKALLRTPIDGARLSSGFGMRRHPIMGYSRMHRGVDFAAPTGTPIYAAGDGVIERASRFGSYGEYVRIRHNDRYSTAYAHLSRYGEGISQGVRVKQGQVIGYVGTTGASTGPHLHYEVLRNGEQINPLDADIPAGTQLAGAELQRFNAARGAVEREIASLRSREPTPRSRPARAATLEPEPGLAFDVACAPPAATVDLSNARSLTCIPD